MIDRLADGGQVDRPAERVLDDMADLQDAEERPSHEEHHRDRHPPQALHQRKRQREGPDGDEAPGVSGVGQRYRRLHQALTPADGVRQRVDHSQQPYPLSVGEDVLLVRHRRDDPHEPRDDEQGPVFRPAHARDAADIVFVAPGLLAVGIVLQQPLQSLLHAGGSLGANMPLHRERESLYQVPDHAALFMPHLSPVDRDAEGDVPAQVQDIVPDFPSFLKALVG
mmetsp:Transcript_80264/g.225591  ORF Transcript_80264/g.225591 Transcript_80264/m.225591 type:complete len:224 (+) Transcript_80264:383-1054(+)